MKKTIDGVNKKLQLRKQAISILSKPQQEKIKGAEALVTTSHIECTGVFCCWWVPSWLNCPTTPTKVEEL
jgi:hypothetical protein